VVYPGNGYGKRGRNEKERTVTAKEKEDGNVY
jgi:hypothetical protein